ncbi:MAG: phosphate/phosphite/phosphonate ABC transporter substrate-binding protein [Cyanobacteria bacterium SID2]|nr:phosphate/phosphite/phosphonate ABC transporter substrate-binding protein [Cyanobacteria bacterium SID2]
MSYTLLFLAGCVAVRDGSGRERTSSITGKPEVLKFAVTDVTGLEQLQQDYGTFREALAEVLEIEVELFPVESFVAAAPAMLSNQLDIAFAGPSEYLLLNARARAVPIVAVTRPTYYPVVVVRRNSDIKSLTDLKGKNVAMQNPGATAGHIYASKFFLDIGLDPRSDIRVKMLKNEGLNALLNGDVDAWMTSTNTYSRWVREAGLSEDDVPILMKGESLPNDLFVANVNLDPEFIEEMRERMLEHQKQLLQALLASPVNDKYSDSEFASVSDSDYDELRELYKALGQEALIQ